MNDFRIAVGISKDQRLGRHGNTILGLTLVTKCSKIAALYHSALFKTAAEHPYYGLQDPRGILGQPIDAL